MLYWIWVLIVGAIIGLLAGVITGRGGSMGFLANIQQDLLAQRQANGWDGNSAVGTRGSYLGISNLVYYGNV